MKAILIAILTLVCSTAHAANFVVYHSDQAFAQQVATKAEQCRRDLSVEWFGRELPEWRQPCPIHISIADHTGGGTTELHFESGRFDRAEMRIEGSPAALLNSAVPHEVFHTVLGAHFGGPLPRWLDEGACATVEHRVDRSRLQRELIRFLKTGRGIAFDRMFAMQEYPDDILPLYAQGHSLCTFLQEHESKPFFVSFVRAGLQGDWRAAVESHYGYSDLGELQAAWLEWVKAGSPLASEANAVASVSHRIQLVAGCSFQWDGRLRRWIRRCGPAPVPQQTQPQVVPLRPRPQQAPAPQPAVMPAQPATSGVQASGDMKAILDALAKIDSRLDAIEAAPIPKGDKGDAGKDGTNGKDGAPGPRGPQGIPGPAGPAGAPGQDVDQGVFVQLQSQVNQLQARLDAPLTVQILDETGAVKQQAQVRLGKDPLRLQLIPVASK